MRVCVGINGYECVCGGWGGGEGTFRPDSDSRLTGNNETTLSRHSQGFCTLLTIMAARPFSFSACR